MEKPSGRNRRLKSWRNQRPQAHPPSHTDRLATHVHANVQSAYDIGDTGIDHQQPALSAAAKQKLHTEDRDGLVLQPNSSNDSIHSVECSPETAALYFKFPTFITKEQLQDHIIRHGFRHNVVSIDMHTNKYTKKPAGSAKVLIIPTALMQDCIETLHGTCLPGEFQQLLSVQPYEQKSAKIFVGPGLPYTITEEDIQKHFVKVKEEITNIEIEREKKRNTCYVLITFRSRNAAKQAIDAYHHTNLFYKQIKVEVYHPKHTRTTLYPATKECPRKRKAGPKVGVTFNSRFEPYNDKFISIDHGTLRTKRAHVRDLRLNSKCQGTSPSKYYTERQEELLIASTTVIAENLDPEFTKKDLEHLSNVRIDEYTPSNLTPDRTAAWITVSNCSDACTIADCLNGKDISRKEIHCFIIGSSELHELVASNKCEVQMKEQLQVPFMTPKSCSAPKRDVQYCQLSVKTDQPLYTQGPQQMTPDKTVMDDNQLNASSTLPQLSLPHTEDVRTIGLQHRLWEYLTTRQPDETMLLQQFIAPFKVNPTVDILLQWKTCSIIISGVPDAVTIAYSHVSDQLDRFLYVEDRVMMSALVYLYPSLPQELGKEHGVTVLGYSETSFIIKFDGTPSLVRAARRVTDGLLSKAIIKKIQFVFTWPLLRIAKKQLTEDHCKTYISCSESKMSDFATNLIVTVCSFDEQHHNTAVTLLQTKELAVEEVSIDLMTMSNVNFIQKLKQLEDDCCVLIQEEDVRDINVHSKQVIITGFCLSRVRKAHSSLVDLLQLYSERHIKLECTPEQVIYLCKVDKESESILSSLPVKVNIKGNEIVLIGSHNHISQSKEIIFNGPLLHLQFKSFVFQHKAIFISPIKQYVCEPLMAENKFQYYIDDDSHSDSDCSRNVMSKTDGFKIVVYSKNESIFSKVCSEIEVLAPETQLFQLNCVEAVHYIIKAKKSFENMYRVCMMIDAGSREITIHGLTSKEIQCCWEHIDNGVKSCVETTKQIPLKRHECMYLEKRQGDKLKQTFSCDITFPQQRECEKYSICIRGKIKDIQSVENRVIDLQAKVQIIKFNVHCRLSLMMMWRMWWSDFINQEQEKHDVIIYVDDSNDSKHGQSIIQVTFEIIGTDVDVLKCIESILRNNETEKRIINVLEENKSVLMDVKIFLYSIHFQWQ